MTLVTLVRKDVDSSHTYLRCVAGLYHQSKMKPFFKYFKVFFLLLSPTNRKSHLFSATNLPSVTPISCVYFG